MIHAEVGSTLLYTSVNVPSVGCVTPFDGDGLPPCLAFADEEGMLLGSIDDIRKVHVTTVPLDGEAPERIAYLKEANAYAVSSAKVIRGPGMTFRWVFAHNIRVTIMNFIGLQKCYTRIVLKSAHMLVVHRFLCVVHRIVKWRTMYIRLFHSSHSPSPSFYPSHPSHNQTASIPITWRKKEYTSWQNVSTQCDRCNLG